MVAINQQLANNDAGFNLSIIAHLVATFDS